MVLETLPQVLSVKLATWDELASVSFDEASAPETVAEHLVFAIPTVHDLK
jgi:hypothetical protein